MKRFDPDTDDPSKFDIEALSFLKREYFALLLGVKEQLINDDWLQIVVHNKRLQSYLNWESLARHLLIGFVTAEALCVGSDDILKLCTYYAKCRLIPIQLFNHAIDQVLYDINFPQPSIHMAEVGIVSLAAQLEGYSWLTKIPGGVKFWEIHVELSSRVVKFFHEELTRRFNVSDLKTPDALLNQYKTTNTPLMRSSTLETFMRGMAAMYGRKIFNEHWLQRYEESRQMLDDLSDIWEDLLVGRLGYPILAALKFYGPNSKLETFIATLWDSLRQGQNRAEVNLEWKTVKEFLNEAGVLRHTTGLIKDWLSEIEDSIYAEQFSGNIQGLITIIDLKKAYLARLIKLNFDNISPDFQFFN